MTSCRKVIHESIETLKKYYTIANNAFAFEDKPYMHRTSAKL